MTALVLLHGLTESSAMWDPLIGSLEADPSSDGNRRVLTVDLRGHGSAPRTPPYDLETMARDALGEIDSTGVSLEDSVLIGHSLGGIVATAMASVSSPRGVINIDQSLSLADFQDTLRPLEEMLRGDDATFQGAITAVFDAMRGPLSDAEFDRLAAIRDADQDVVLGVWSPLLDSEASELDALVEAVCATVSCPYLALFGIDPGPEYPAWLTERIAGAHTEVWADHGHYPHLVEPERFVDRVDEFVGSLD
ncbi:MAG: alpha/beta fold hydrolase [Microthrixaceae bacterium]